MKNIEIVFEEFKNKIIILKEQFEKDTESNLLIFSDDGTWDIVMVKNVSKIDFKG